MRPASSLAVFLLACLLSACGGGGGGDSDGGTTPQPPTPPQPPVEPTTFTLSGTITAASGQVADSDTNDPTREAISNDSLALAQPLPNPVTLGGYVNRPGTGEPGRSRTQGDIDDYYRLDLLAGQRVTMLVADFEEADADLYLYDETGEIVDLSIDTGEIESLEIAQSGTYFVNAFAFSGGSNYTLIIGNSIASEGGRPASLEVVAGEVIVKMRSELFASDTATTAAMNAMGMEYRAGSADRERLMGIRAGRATHTQTKARTGVAFSKRGAINDDALRARWETLHLAKAMRTLPGVEYAEPNYIVRRQFVPNDDVLPLQWHYPLISMPFAWDTTTGNRDIVVAVIDSGVLTRHPDLIGQFVDGFDFVRDPENAADGNGIDSNPTDPGDALGGAGSFHGTHVSGTVAARGNNSRGVAGVAYGSRIMPLRALGVDGGTTYDVGQALRYAAGLPNDSGTLPVQPADIINMSLGGGGFSQTQQNLLRDIRAGGVIIVAAAGNEASSQPGYPAAYDGVISVSAVDSQRRLAAYSNTGPTVDIAAPGGDNSADFTGDGYPDGVLSTSGNNSNGQLTYTYSFLSGTSMATPHVAGVIALMKSINRDLTPDDIDALLSAGALTDDLGRPGRDDQFGHGLINAQSAVIAALDSIGSTPADNPRLIVSSSNLNYGSVTNDLSLTLRNGGRGSLTLESVTTSEPWLTVTALSVDAGGLGEYRATVDRSDLTAGVYAAEITARSSVNTQTVRVFMTVGGTNFNADVGVLYILLLDTAGDTALQFVSAGAGGSYPFVFNGVAPGSYELVAGSDADNDLRICDAGESCGAYLTTDQPIRLEVGADRADLDFPVEFVVSLPSLQGSALARSPRDSDSKSAVRSLP